MDPAEARATYLENLLAAAKNPLRSDIDRKIAWDTYEREKWFDAVNRTDGDRLHAADLEPKFDQSVKALIVARSIPRPSVQ